MLYLKKRGRNSKFVNIFQVLVDLKKGNFKFFRTFAMIIQPSKNYESSKKAKNFNLNAL